MTRLAASLLVAILLAACGAIQPARMALPPDIDQGAERLAITGLGWAPRGEFRVGNEEGSFSRSASRLALFDSLYEGERAVASFTLQQNGNVTARCGMRRRTVNVGVLTHETRPMIYACSFDGQGEPARLSLQEARRTTRLVSMLKERSGEMLLGDVRVRISSAHALAGSPLQTAAPIGYMFERNGQTVAALEINGAKPVIFLPPAASSAERKAIVLAALALALLWDPQETGLAD